MEKLKTVNEVLNSLQLKHIETLNVPQISLLNLIYDTCKAMENLLSKHKNIMDDKSLNVLKFGVLNEDEVSEDFCKEQQINQLRLCPSNSNITFIINYVYNDSNKPIAFFVHLIGVFDERDTFNWSDDSWIEINADDSNRLRRQDFIPSIFQKVNLINSK